MALSRLFFCALQALLFAEFLLHPFVWCLQLWLATAMVALRWRLDVLYVALSVSFKDWNNDAHQLGSRWNTRLKYPI